MSVNIQTSSPFSHHEMVFQYIKACCLDPDPARFAGLLSKEVKLIHFTNGILVSDVKGNEKVIEIYKEKLFNVTTGIKVSSYCIRPCNDHQAEMHLTVSENKGDGQRWKFTDRTIFEFTTEDGELKISSIYTRAQKESAMD